VDDLRRHRFGNAKRFAHSRAVVRVEAGHVQAALGADDTQRAMAAGAVLKLFGDEALFGHRVERITQFDQEFLAVLAAQGGRNRAAPADQRPGVAVVAISAAAHAAPACARAALRTAATAPAALLPCRRTALAAMLEAMTTW